MARSIDPPAASPRGPSAPISVALKETPDRLVLIAANRGGSAVEVTFSSPRLKTGPAKEETREVKITAGALRDSFEPYAVHVYDLPR